MSLQYLAQLVGVQALVGDESPAVLCEFAFEHVAHPLLTFLDFGFAVGFRKNAIDSS